MELIILIDDFFFFFEKFGNIDPTYAFQKRKKYAQIGSGSGTINFFLFCLFVLFCFFFVFFFFGNKMGKFV